MRTLKVMFVVLSMIVVCSVAGAETFRFTASADNRPYDSGNLSRWEWLLDEMDRLFLNDEGVFHIMPGDIDPPEVTDASLKTQFGEGVVWYPVVGNHEAETPADMTWIREAFSNLPYVVNSGPSGCETTTYSFDYGNAHFVAINEYYNGTSDTGTDGDVVDALYKWLADDLAANTKPVVFVIGHEPAYPEYAHTGDSLNKYPANRDRFWKLLNDEQVIAYLCGHTHWYYAKQVGGVDWEPFTWQIDCGNAGNPRELEQTFVDVSVTDTDVTFTVWQGTEDMAYGIRASWTVNIPAPTASLLVPLDNGPDDLDPDEGEVTVNSTQPVFDIQLSAVGDGINDGTVTSAAVAISKDSVPLTEGTHYSFGYDAGSDVITLTPAVSPFGNGLYAITLSGIADLAGNPMAETTLSILIDTSIVPPETVTFQQGVDGYESMVDTMIRWADPATNFADSATQYDGSYQYQYNADTDSSGGPSHVLLRFDGIIGANQIPAGSTIVSATLRIRSTDDGNGGKAHAMLQPWIDTVITWNNSFGGDGIQANDSEALIVEDDGVPSNSPDTDVDLDVTATLQDWADGVANNGWAILPNGTNGWHMAAAEHPTVDFRPELIVTFTTNQRPVANDDTATTIENEAVIIDVLANDTDADGNPLLGGSVASVTQGANGTVVINADETDETVTYTPNLDFDGTDTFTYQASDGQSNSAPATVTVTIIGDNDPPVTQNDSYDLMPEEAVLSVDVLQGVLANDSDPEHDPLTATLSVGPDHGSVTLDPEGSFTYTPDDGFAGLDSFAYLANDGTNSSPATVEITVYMVVETEDVAQSEIALDGVVDPDVDGYLNTWSDDDNAEVITEVVSGKNQAQLRSALEHKWQFDVAGGDTVEFHLDAHALIDAQSPDTFVFSYSTDDVTYTDIATVTEPVDDDYPLPDAINGTVYIRVQDTNRDRLETTADDISIDYMCIRSTTTSLPDSEPPTPPTGLFATTGDTQISLTWNPNGESDIAGYKVYRDEILISGVTLVTTTEYTDTGLMNGTSYTYKITAVDTSDNESTQSDPISATPQDLPPAAPTGLSAMPGDGQVSLHWDDNTESDIAGYNVYRSESPGAPYSQINASLATTSDYVDSTAVNGTTYYYVVTAVDSATPTPNESSYSSEVSATPDSQQVVYVASIAMSLESAGKNTKASAGITISEAQAGATVYGEWYLKGALIQSDATGVTDAGGYAVLVSVPKKAKSRNVFRFVVTDVVLGGYLYDPGQGVTENSITVP